MFVCLSLLKTSLKTKTHFIETIFNLIVKNPTAMPPNTPDSLFLRFILFFAFCAKHTNDLSVVHSTSRLQHLKATNGSFKTTQSIISVCDCQLLTVSVDCELDWMQWITFRDWKDLQATVALRSCPPGSCLLPGPIIRVTCECIIMGGLHSNTLSILTKQFMIFCLLFRDCVIEITW